MARLCLRNLLTAKRGDPAFADAKRVQRGIAQVQATGDLHGLPAIVVHGRSDALVPTNHSSRAYYGRNLLEERHRSNLHYYEITNGQHFDAFLGLPGFDTRYIPVHYYFNQAMDLMFAHLRGGAALPASQVVRTTPRGGTPGAAPAISPMNMPAIAATPSVADSITFVHRTLSLPDGRRRPAADSPCGRAGR